MNPCRVRPPELRQLDTLLTALLQDAELMAELSMLQREQIESASVTLRSLFAIADARAAEDAWHES
jgi:hypothetical protein